MDCRASVSLLFLFLCSNRAMVFGQEVGELLVRRLLEHGLLPQVWCEIGVGLGDGGVCRLGEVAKRPSGSSGAGVAILNTGHLQQLLRDGGRHDTGTAGSRDQTHPDGATFTSHLARYSVRLADLVSPESPPDGNDGELGQNDGPSDGGGDLLGALDTQADVTVVVADGNKRLEPGSLSGSGLLLDRHDLQNLVLQSRADKVINNLVLLDGKGEKIDLLQGFDLSILDKPPEFRHRDPIFLFLTTATTASTAATSATTTVAAATTTSKPSSETSTIGWCCVRHDRSLTIESLLTT